MKPCRHYEPLLTEGLFGGLSADDEARLARHLQQCPACAGLYRELRATVALTAGRPAPDPGRAFWEGYYDALAARLEAESPAAPVWRHRLAGARERLAHSLRPMPRWAYGLSTGLALVAFGVLLGWLLFRPAVPPALVERPVLEQPAGSSPAVAEDLEAAVPEAPVPLEEQAARDAGLAGPADAPPVVEEPLRQAASERQAAEASTLETRTTRYLERSKVLLLGLVNLEPAQEAVLDLSSRQTVARELVREAGTLKTELSQADQALLRTLVADLELILMQIANLEAGIDVPAIELVKSGVDRRAVLLKINLAEMQQAEAGAHPLGTTPR
jgi:anti-sigma factor RsiW